MNWNGQRPWVDHFIATRSDAAGAPAAQAALNERRRRRLFEAALTRPIYLPLTFALPATGQVSPIRDTTTSLGHDVLIVGARSDTQTRDIVVRATESDRSLVRIGDETSLYLRCDEFAGQLPGNGGQTGIQYWPVPILLRQGQRITIEMFKTDTTADAEEANIVLVGIRAYGKEYANALLDAGEMAAVDHFLNAREFPAVTHLKVAWNFSTALAGGEARNILTPRVEEPLLVRGVRTSLRNSLIEIGLASEPSWTVEETPYWAIAGEDELIADNWLWFPKPIYLRRNAQIELRRIVNSIDTGTPLDAQNGNTMTFYCETV